MKGSPLSVPVNYTSQETSSLMSKTKETLKSPVLDSLLSWLEDSKAEEITVIDMRDKSALADFMIIASGRSQRHVIAIADHLSRQFKDSYHSKLRIEGHNNGNWVLIDSGDIILHLFHPETRAFYNLEKLWQDPDSSTNYTVHGDSK